MEKEKEQQPVWLTIATVKGGIWVVSQRLYYEDRLREEQSGLLDEEYGPGNWVIVPTDDRLADFNPLTYTVENGGLIPAPAEVLEARREAEKVRKAEALRAERDGRLAETDKYLIPDFPISEQQREQYRAYRQYLRDLPEAEGFPEVEIKTIDNFLQ